MPKALALVSMLVELASEFMLVPVIVIVSPGATAVILTNVIAAAGADSGAIISGC